MAFGAAQVMVGVSLFAAIVMLTAVDVVCRPAASRARAAIVCAPLVALVESQLIEYGNAVNSGPIATPSSRNCTPTTPTSSDAFAATTTLTPETAPLAGAVIDTVGAAVSMLTMRMLAKFVLPLMSRAIA